MLDRNRRRLAAALILALVAPVVAWAVLVVPVAGNDSYPPTCSNWVGDEVSCSASLPLGIGAMFFVVALSVFVGLIAVADVLGGRGQVLRTMARITANGV